MISYLLNRVLQVFNCKEWVSLQINLGQRLNLMIQKMKHQECIFPLHMQIWYQRVVLAGRVDHQNLGLWYIFVVLSVPSGVGCCLQLITCMRLLASSWEFKELECMLHKMGLCWGRKFLVFLESFHTFCHATIKRCYHDSVIGVSESPLSFFLPVAV